MARFENKYIIGLTGNIAVGKSVVRRMLQHLGAYTIDADSLSHQATMPGAPAYKPVADMFGKYILDPNGQINRSKLGAIAFAIPDALVTLEGIIHPVVNGAIQQLIGRASQRVIVIEAIKLMEGSLASMCDALWVVDAPRDQQILRLIKDRGLSEAEAVRRIDAQNPQADKLARAQVVIHNGGDVDSTWKQVQDAWHQIPTEAPVPLAAQFLAATDEMASAPAFPAVKPITQSPPPPPAASPAMITVKTDTQEIITANGIRARRGTPNHAEQIASFISRVSGRAVSRMDIMLGFGQKSYHTVMDEAGEIMAVAGWQVENLIATIDEVYVSPDAPLPAAVISLIGEIENAARALQSEVSFVYLPVNGTPAIRQGFVKASYTTLSIDDLTSPAWRESASEQLRDGRVGLMKALRQDRVTKPI